MPIYLKKELMGFKDKRLAAFNGFKPSSKIFLLTVPKRHFFCGSFVFSCLVLDCFDS